MVFLFFAGRSGREENKKTSDTIESKGLELIRRQAEEKSENMEKLREYARGRGAITNDEAEKLLAVSNATAERYLNELEKEGLLEQVGDIGQAVHYRVKSSK